MDPMNSYREAIERVLTVYTKIVLAFRPPEARKLTEYAVA